MTVPKISCPECSTVLRPAKPVAAGKKIKCPKCETVFTVGADEEDDEAPRQASVEKKTAKAASAKRGDGKGKAAPAPAAKEDPAKPKDDDDGIGVYNVFKDEDDEQEDPKDQGKRGKKGAPRVEKKKKPQIEYAPDMSIKDLRGPAVAILMASSNKLTLVGFLGAFGWLTLIILLTIPAVFPVISDKEGEVNPVGAGLGSVSPSRAFVFMPPVAAASADGEKKPTQDGESRFFDVGGVDISRMCELPWYVFWPSLLPLVVLMGCSGIVAYGAIQAQNLESRAWGITGSIMAMLPLNCAGLQLVTTMVIQFGLGMVIDDTQFNSIVAAVVSGAEWVASVAIGIWMLVTLMNKDVIAGFEYVAE